MLTTFGEEMGTLLQQSFDDARIVEYSEPGKYETEEATPEMATIVSSTLYRKTIGPFGIFGVLQVLQASQNSFTNGVVVGVAGLHFFGLSRLSPNATIVNAAQTRRLDLGFNVFTRRMVARYYSRQLPTQRWHFESMQTVIAW